MFRWVKYFPYFLVFYSVCMLVPSLFWKKYFAPEINRQTEFLVDGFVEGLTMIVGGMTEVVKSGEQVSEEAINSEMLAATNENIYKFILFFRKKK